MPFYLRSSSSLAVACPAQSLTVPCSVYAHVMLAQSDAACSLQIFTGWVVTILFACALCSLFVALGVNSPSRYSIDQIIDAQQVR